MCSAGSLYARHPLRRCLGARRRVSVPVGVPQDGQGGPVQSWIALPPPAWHRQATACESWTLLTVVCGCVGRRITSRLRSELPSADAACDAELFINGPPELPRHQPWPVCPLSPDACAVSSPVRFKEVHCRMRDDGAEWRLPSRRRHQRALQMKGENLGRKMQKVGNRHT